MIAVDPPLAPDVTLSSTPGENYRLRIQCEGPRVRVWRNGAGEGTELLFDATTRVHNTTQLKFVCTGTAAYVDDACLVARHERARGSS